jgi:hypothetical protein
MALPVNAEVPLHPCARFFSDYAALTYVCGWRAVTYPLVGTALVAREQAPPPAPGPRRLLDRVRDALRARHYSRRTEKAYVAWIRRYILFHGPA